LSATNLPIVSNQKVGLERWRVDPADERPAQNSSNKFMRALRRFGGRQK
jgi:hypothetical protein